MNNWRFLDVKKFLSKYRFTLSHVHGSHYFYIGSHEGKVGQVCVPFHGTRAIHPKTMKSIARQSGIPENKWKA